MIYSHLRTRLHRRRLPAPNQRGTDTAGEFGFTRNAALLPEPIQRFPRPETPPAALPMRRRRIIAVAGAGALGVAATLSVAKLGGSGKQAAHTGIAKVSIVVGSANFAESTLINRRSASGR